MNFEDYIQDEEKAEYKWTENHLAQEKVILEQIDEMLLDSTVKSRQNLLYLLHNKDLLTIYESRTPFAYLKIIIRIYEKELQSGELITILDMGSSHEELISKLTQLKFYLWRIIFIDDEQSHQSIIEFIQQNHVSPYMLQYLVLIVSVNKDQLLLKLVNLFLERNMFRYAFHMLDYLVHLFPNNENYLYLAAKFSESIGKNQK